MRILIPTHVRDSHARIVQRALASRGHEAVPWFGADLPIRQTLSVHVDPAGEPDISIVGNEIATDGEFDVVWMRRATSAVLPDDMHPGDRTFAEREWSRFSAGAWRVLSPRAFWVNPIEAGRAAEGKLLQLTEAARVGLAIPPTLFGNDPQRIRSFVRACAGGAIYKPFASMRWETEQGVACLFTSVIAEDDLPDDDVLRLSPGIFQPRIAKAHELRVTVIGERVFAAKLDSQAIDAARIDWRAGQDEVAVTPARLPEPVEARCRALVRRLGLVFGCIDIIVTPTGEHVFLEINPMGQFLWVEELAPEIPLLDAFCSLLIQARPDFGWAPESARLRFADFVDDEGDAELDAAHQVHAHWFAVSDAAAAGESRMH